MAKIYHIINLFFFNLLWVLLSFYILFSKKLKPSKEIKKIALLPYTPKGWYGGEERIAHWKKYFDSEGYQSNVFWAWNVSDMIRYDKGSWLAKYWIYGKIAYQRYKTFFALASYDVVWIQRAYVPLYPFKEAMFEKLLFKKGINWKVDFYDPDYMSNPHYVREVANLANGVSVVNLFLKSYFLMYGCKNVEVLPLTIDNSHYKIKEDYSRGKKFRLIWMGSTANNFEILRLEKVLLRIQQEYDFFDVLIICNNFVGFRELNAEIHSWNEATFYNLLKSCDVGIVPVSYDIDESWKGKMAKKSIEFMAIGMPIIASPYGISNALIHNETALLASNDEEWYDCINKLIRSEDIRSNLGRNARKAFFENHAYESQFEKLKRILIN